MISLYQETPQIRFSSSLALILIIALLLWTTGLPFWLERVRASQLTSAKDTLTDSRPAVVSGHAIAFTTVTAIGAGSTIKVQFDPAGDLFVLTGITTSDLSATGMTLVATCGAGADEVTFALDATAPDENFTFTVCSGDTVATGAKTITANGTNKATNPVSTGSYVIRITGPSSDQADVRVAIVDAVTVTASVDTTLTFTVAGVASGQAVNGDGVTTSAGATATALPFATTSPATPKVLAQTLTVTTNAKNGFVVTVQQNQNLLSANGADIDLFKDGAATAVPTAWTVPLGTLDTENTYGHYGVTSEDADLNSDEFGTALYAGNLATARQVFSHTGPADGSTANKGLTRVAVKLEIHALQEAAPDYNNRLTYIATPTF